MSDDYLWDGSGTPDPDVQRLERMLGPLRTTAAQLNAESAENSFSRRISTISAIPAPYAVPLLNTSLARAQWRSVRFLGPALAAAAAIALMVGMTWPGRHGPSWEVASINGQPRIGATPIAGEGRLAIGQTLTTDAASRARVEVSTIGQVTVEADTRVRLVDTRDAHHKLALERGTLHAFIVAAPGQFVVDTPSATATDLGCVYDLTVDEDGTGLLTVVAGWVAFEENGRESFVPAGASARTDRTSGPGTPRYDDAEPEFKAALDEIDSGREGARKWDPLRVVIDRARPGDAMTLWHLIARVAPADRGAVVDALAARVAMPASVTRDAVMRLDRTALDHWWDALGLRDAGFWRTWKRALPDR